MGPRKANNRRVPIIDELYGPPPFIFDPDKNDARCVARSQFLIRLIPSDKSYLQAAKKSVSYLGTGRHAYLGHLIWPNSPFMGSLAHEYKVCSESLSPRHKKNLMKPMAFYLLAVNFIIMGQLGLVPGRYSQKVSLLLVFNNRESYGTT